MVGGTLKPVIFEIGLYSGLVGSMYGLVHREIVHMIDFNVHFLVRAGGIDHVFLATSSAIRDATGNVEQRMRW